MKDININELLENKSFEELSSEEQMKVENYLKKEEYESQHEVIAKAKKGYKKELDAIPYNTELLKSIKESSSHRKSILPLWLTKPVPSYALGLAVLAFLLLYTVTPTKTTELIVYRDGPKEVKIDTVFMRDTVFKSTKLDPSPTTKKLVSRPKNKYNRKSIIRPTASYAVQKQYFDGEQLKTQRDLVGKSSKESGELAQFLGVRI